MIDAADYFLNGNDSAVADAPPVAPPADAPPAQPPADASPADAPPTAPPKPADVTFDEPKYLAEVSENKWKSKDDIKSTFTKLSEYEKKVSDLESSQKELFKPANERIKKLNEIALAGGNENLFLQVSAVDVDKLSDLDKVKLNLQWQKGLTPEHAAFKVNRQYLVGEIKKPLLEDGETVDEEKLALLQADKQAADIDLAIDAKEAEKFLKGVQVKASTVPDHAKEAETLNTQRIEQWTPNISKTVSEVGKITHQFKFNEGKDVIDFEYELSADQKKHLEGMFADTIKNVQLNFDDETKKEFVTKIIPNWAKAEFHEDIMNAQANKINSAMEAKWKERISGKKPEGDAGVNTVPATDNQKAINAFL